MEIRQFQPSCLSLNRPIDRQLASCNPKPVYVLLLSVSFPIDITVSIGLIVRITVDVKEQLLIFCQIDEGIDRFFICPAVLNRREATFSIVVLRLYYHLVADSSKVDLLKHVEKGIFLHNTCRLSCVGISLVVATIRISCFRSYVVYF